KTTDLEKGLPTEETAGGAGAEHALRPQIARAERLTMAALAGDPSHVIAIAGTIQRGCSVLSCHAKDERGHRRHGRIMETSQGGLGPAGGDFSIIVEQFNNRARDGGDTGI